MRDADFNPAQLQNLVDACLQLPIDQREAQARRAAAHDAVLLEALLLQLRMRKALPESRRSSNYFGAVTPSGEVPLPPALQGLQAGTTVGDYTLTRFLGRGNMGQVWEARQASLQRDVALKLMLPGTIDEDSLRRFLKEARAGGRARHPNLVMTYERGHDDGFEWIAQELVRGSHSLQDAIEVLREKPRLAGDHFAKVAQLVEKLARGLAAAHSVGVIHRDLKPQNILIDEGDEPKVADFGLARVADDSAPTLTVEFSGTLLYMSPEQVAAKRSGLDARTDIFSLGVILYELLTLQRPFHGDTTQVIEQIQSYDPKRADRVRAGCPTDLGVIAEKAMQKLKVHRYPTMEALADDLRRFLNNEPILARPTGKLERAQKWMRRNPTATATVATGLLGILGIAWFAWQSLQASERATLERDRFSMLARAETLQRLQREARELLPASPLQRSQAEAVLVQVDEALRIRPALPAQASAKDRQLWVRNEELERTIGSEGPHTEQRLRMEYGRLREAIEEARSTHAEPWREVAARVRDNPRYSDSRAMELVPMDDLVPLGPDPASGLEEFAHFPSGSIPARDAATGQLEFAEDAGIVFVLVPGGVASVGASQNDVRAYPNERPQSQVRLDAFLLGKHEITRGQWMRLSGAGDPSRYKASDSPPAGATFADGSVIRTQVINQRSPVESVSGIEAESILHRFGLALPSEAQWEHACRAGTRTTWCTGDAPEALLATVSVNICDRAAHRANVPSTAWEEWESYEDGFILHACVGSMPPNPWGLHEMLCNVAEFCADGFRPDYGFGLEDGLGAHRAAAPRPHQRAVRGGSWYNGLRDARPSKRRALDERSVYDNVGVRAARNLPR